MSTDNLVMGALVVIGIVALVFLAWDEHRHGGRWR